MADTGFRPPSATSGGASDPLTDRIRKGSGGAGTAGGNGGSTFKPPSAGATPGTYNINILDPLDSAQSAFTETKEGLEGMRQGLFGQDEQNIYGQHGGLLGDIPVIGDVARGFTNVLGAGGNVVGAGLGAITNAASTDIAGLATKVATGNPLALQAQLTEMRTTRDAFMALPDDSPAKQDVLARLEADPSLYVQAGHLMSEALRTHKTKEKALTQKPGLYDGLFTPGPSLLDTVGNIGDIFAVVGRPIEKWHAGSEDAGNKGRSGKTRVGEIEAFGKGEIDQFGTVGGFGADIGGEMNELEAIVYQKVHDQDWTEEEALDFLVANGSGFSRDPMWEIAGQVAYDPTIYASLGMGAYAKVGQTAATLARYTRLAEEGVTAARTTGEASKVAEAEAVLAKTLKDTARFKGASARINLFGKALETERGSDIVRFAGTPYVRAQGTALAKTAKVARTIIDPMSAMTGVNPGTVKHLDLLTDATVKRTIDATGQLPHLNIVRDLIDISPGLADQFHADYATYSGNLMRRVVAGQHRSAQYAAGAVEALRQSLPDNVIPELLRKAPEKYLDEVFNEANRWRMRDWDVVAQQNLALRLGKMYKHLDEEQWLAYIQKTAARKGGADMLSYLHQGTYGYATRRMLQTVAAARVTGISKLGDKLDQLVLMNKRTLSKQGAGGIIERIAEAGTLEEKVAVIEHEMSLYDTLGFVTIDHASPAQTVEDFTTALSKMHNYLPTQVEYDELAEMGTDFAGLIDEMQGAFNLGFRPDDEFLWGLERLNKAGGRLVPIGDVWTGHVADEVASFSPVRAIPTNIIGQTLPRTVGKAYRALDYADAVGRVMKSRVSGVVIAEAAKARFVQNVTHLPGSDLTKKEASDIMEALLEAVNLNSHIVTPRGMSTTNMWNAVKETVPKRLSGRFGPNEVMTAVLDAYEGDTRFVGLTQALTGRMKRLAGGLEGQNRLGQLSEDLYPRLKFHLNPFFQVQEKIEPWVLSVQRGIEPAYGSKLNEADTITQQVLDNLDKTSVIRQADVDSYEYSAKVLLGNQIHKNATTAGTVHNAAINALRGAGDVAGTKRVALLRTFRKGLGKELKKAWDEHDAVLFEAETQAARDAGEDVSAVIRGNTWRDMQDHASMAAGGIVSDDDFAIQMLSENFLGNDFLLNRAEKAARRFTPEEFKSALKPGEWALPSHMGELKPVGLNDIAQLLHLADDEQGLRSAISGGTLRVEDVSAALRYHGADRDFILRTENALNFSWEGFWETARGRFNLTPRESSQLQDYVAAMASMRHTEMSPVEYLSQVFSPHIIDGEEGTLGSLGKALDVLRRGGTSGERGLAEIAAKPGGYAVGEGRDALIRQLSGVFSDHLDPSAKAALIREFRTDIAQAVDEGTTSLTSAGGQTWDLAAINAAWTPEMEQKLADAVIRHIEVAPATSLEELVAREPALLSKNFVRDLAPELHDEVLKQLNELRASMPGVRIDLAAIDKKFHTPTGRANPLDASGEFAGVLPTERLRPRLLLSPRYFGRNKAVREASWAQDVAVDERSWLENGIGSSVSATPAGTVRHEYGHGFIEHLSDRVAYNPDVTQAQRDAAKAVTDFISDFYDNYEMDFTTVGSARPAEMGAEMFDFAFGPEENRVRYMKKLREMAAFDPTGTPEERALAAAAVDSMEADLTKFRELVEATGMYTPYQAPPDVMRTADMFTEWSQKAVAGALTKDETLRGDIGQVLNDLGGLPVGAGTQYDATQAYLFRAANDAMTEKFDDAYRLQYYKRGRTMLERSINHPLFGLYPASYMWGKMLPEMTRFVAATPFGVHTTAMAYALFHAQKAVAAQREFNPDFDAFIEKIGHSQAMYMASALMPAAPWDLPASASPAFRSIAQQGLDQKARMAKGEPSGEINILDAAAKSAEQMSPLRGFQTLDRALNEQLKVTPEELAQRLQEQQAEGAVPAPAAPTGPVQGTSLGPTLTESLQQLRDVLSAP